MRKLTMEQPPIIADPRLREWLSRMVNNINACIDQMNDLDGIGELPKNPQNGMIRYFKTTIAPDITSPGFWGYHDGWKKFH